MAAEHANSICAKNVLEVNYPRLQGEGFKVLDELRTEVLCTSQIARTN